LKDLLVEVLDHGQVVLEGELAQGMILSLEELLLEQMGFQRSCGCCAKATSPSKRTS
jgi:hypothetical protein